MAFDRRLMVMLSPSSSTRTFSSRVPNNVSMLGLIPILFFIQFEPCRNPDEPRRDRRLGCPAERSEADPPRSSADTTPHSKDKAGLCSETGPTGMLVPGGQATTIG